MSNKKKIMLVAKSLEQGGIEVMIRETAKELRDQGYDVSVFTFGEKAHKQHIGDLIEMDGTRIIYGGVDGLSLAKTAKKLGLHESELRDEHVRSIIRKDLTQPDVAEPYLTALSDAIQNEKPDGIISFHAKTHLLLDMLKPSLPRTTQLSFCLGGLNQESYLLQPEHEVFRNTLRNNRVIYCGQTVRNAYVEQLFPTHSATNAERMKNHVAIPNGIDCNRFTFNAKDHQQVRENLGIPQDAKVIIFPARYSFQKNVPVFIEAMQYITRERADVHVIMCGRDMDKQDPRLSAVANHSRFHLLGERSDIRDLLSASDIYVNTSGFEGLSIAMLEAMACGNHPIVTLAGDAAQVTDDIGTPIQFTTAQKNPHNPIHHPTVAEVAESLRYALSLPLDREAPRQRVKERYSLSTMVKEYIKFLFSPKQPVLGR